jgi:hypothetical protein
MKTKNYKRNGKGREAKYLKRNEKFEEKLQGSEKFRIPFRLFPLKPIFQFLHNRRTLLPTFLGVKGYYQRIIISVE